MIFWSTTNQSSIGGGEERSGNGHVAKWRETTYFLQKMVNLGDWGSGKQGRCFVNTGQ